MVKGTRRCLMAVLAHPDDETFGCGGLLARYAAEEVRVVLICATRGEVGEISDPSLATVENLAQVRERELREACDILGVEEIIILGYRDSGMAGTPDNEHPQALCRAPQAEVVGGIVEVVRREKPDVILTFDLRGGYGHPDHIAVNQAAREAFAAAANPSRYPEQLDGGLRPHRPRKLYYFVIPRSF
ncbi:MAG: PIG-L family deacetylase, partial [Dehalococcoidia bacterium]